MKKSVVFLCCVIGFIFVAAPIFMETPVQVLLNGKPFAKARLINGVWAVPLEDFARAATGTPNLGSSFQVQGNRLVAMVSGNSRPQTSSPANTIGGVAQLNAVAPSAAIQNNMFHARKAGEVSSHLLTLNGKTFIPLADVAKAGGGVWTPPANVAPGQTFTLNFTVNGDGVLAFGH